MMMMSDDDDDEETISAAIFVRMLSTISALCRACFRGLVTIASGIMFRVISASPVRSIMAIPAVVSVFSFIPFGPKLRPRLFPAPDCPCRIRNRSN